MSLFDLEIGDCWSIYSYQWNYLLPSARKVEWHRYRDFSYSHLTLCQNWHWSSVVAPRLKNLRRAACSPFPNCKCRVIFCIHFLKTVSVKWLSAVSSWTVSVKWLSAVSFQTAYLWLVTNLKVVSDEIRQMWFVANCGANCARGWLQSSRLRPGRIAFKQIGAEFPLSKWTQPMQIGILILGVCSSKFSQ